MFSTNKMKTKQYKKHPEDLPSDDELEAVEDKDGTDIVDPVEFKKMQKEIVDRLIIRKDS